MEALKIETFPVGSFSCNCSIIYSDVTKECVIIDPGDDLELITQVIQERSLVVKKLLHTHAHFDHIGCSKDLASTTGAKLFLHRGDDELYRALSAQTMMFGLPPREPGKIDDYLEDGQVFGLEEGADDHIHDTRIKSFLKTIYTPGHTEGSCCFYSELFETPLLFAGDTLFRSSIGRTDLPGGDFEKIKKSISQRLYQLPDETQVITGHGPSTRIFEEKRTNPFVRA